MLGAHIKMFHGIAALCPMELPNLNQRPVKDPGKCNAVCEPFCAFSHGNSHISGQKVPPGGRGGCTPLPGR